MKSFALALLAALSLSAFADTAPAISLPDLNPSEWFDGKMGGTKFKAIKFKLAYCETYVEA